MPIDMVLADGLTSDGKRQYWKTEDHIVHFNAQICTGNDGGTISNAQTLCVFPEGYRAVNGEQCFPATVRTGHVGTENLNPVMCTVYSDGRLTYKGPDIIGEPLPGGDRAYVIVSVEFIAD